MEYELIEDCSDRCALSPRRDGGLAEEASPDRVDRPLIDPHHSHWPERSAQRIAQMGEG